MDAAEFERLYHIVAFERGEPYVRARDRLVQHGESFRRNLQARADDGDWRWAFAAQIVLGWMDHAEEFRLCTGYLDATVRAPAGRFSRLATMDPAQIRAAADMKPLVVPRLIELMIKTDEFRFESAPWVRLMDAAGADPPFREVMAAIMSDPNRSWRERSYGADKLQTSFRDPRWLPFARALAWDENAPVDDRWEAFGMLADERFLPAAEREEEHARVRTALRDPSTSEATRAAVVYALESFHDRSSFDVALSFLPRAQTPALRRAILLGIDSFEVTSALPEVARLAHSDPDDEARGAAEETLEGLREALEPSRADLSRARAALRDRSTNEDDSLVAVVTLSRHERDERSKPQSVDALLHLLHLAPSAALRLQTVDTLERLGDRRALPTLTELARSDPDARVREKAAHAAEGLAPD